MKIKTQRGHTSWKDCQTPHPTYAVWDLLHSSFLLVAEKKGRDKTFHNLGSRWHSRHLESHRGSTGPQQFAGVAFSECAVLKSFKKYKEIDIEEELEKKKRSLKNVYKVYSVFCNNLHGKRI